MAVALGFDTFTLEGKVCAGFTLVVTVLTLVAVVGFGLASVEITEMLLVGADELIGLGVILKTVSAERKFADDVGIAVAVCVLIEGGVFGVVAEAVFFEVLVILLAAIGGIRDDLFWLAFQFLEMWD